MKLRAVKGNIVYKGNEIAQGETFECDKEVAKSLLVANVVEEVVAPKKAKKELEK